jgi:hypothetical protein
MVLMVGLFVDMISFLGTSKIPTEKDTMGRRIATDALAE